MGIKYTKDQIEAMIGRAIIKGKPLYKVPCVNHNETLIGSTEFTSEAIASYLLANPHLINSGIKRIRRDKTYNVKHSKKPRALNSNRAEELLAIQLVKNHHTGPEYGTMIAYQVPLKNSNKDVGVGRIDLVSYHEGFKKLFIHEFKRKENTETLLRSALEIYTYFSTIDQRKVLKDFGYSNAQLVPSVLVYAGSKQHNQYEIQENVKILMKQLYIEFHLLEETNYN